MLVVCEPQSRWRFTVTVFRFTGGTPAQLDEAVALARSWPGMNVRVLDDETPVQLYTRSYWPWRRMRWLDMSRGEETR